ncbi:hypothetical protein GGR92_001534 [Spirosoma lacussanchae]|uniref:hypothetical protein n=1 Tax=Spirosoma lacussanchae TaxID=1884249 RepID=UPI001109EB6F|nr:hypothetical protein [Spirosoma lacussanchae]
MYFMDMKRLSDIDMATIEGSGKVGCAVAVAGFALGVAGLAMTGVGAPLAATLVASQGYVAGTVGLMSCFTNKF